MLFISFNFLFGYIMAVTVPGTGEWIAAISLESYFYSLHFSSWQKYIHIINLHRKKRVLLNTSPSNSKRYVCLNTTMARCQCHANLEYTLFKIFVPVSLSDKCIKHIWDFSDLFHFPANNKKDFSEYVPE